MYDLHYWILRENYGKDVDLVTLDNESFLLDFKSIDVYGEMQNGALKQHNHFSNFPTSHPLYSEENNGKLGLLKSETSNNLISEAICLAPKY